MLGMSMNLASGTFYIQTRGSVGPRLFVLAMSLLIAIPGFVLWKHRAFALSSATVQQATGLLIASLVLATISFVIGVRALKQDQKASLLFQTNPISKT